MLVSIVRIAERNVDNMIDFYDIPWCITHPAELRANEFDALIERECGTDEKKQHEFVCNWTKNIIENVGLRLVLAHISDSEDMAKFMCFVADYVEAFEIGQLDAIGTFGEHFRTNKVAAADRLMTDAYYAYHACDADFRKEGDFSKPTWLIVKNIEDDETLSEEDMDAILSKELQGLTDTQLLELMTTVFGICGYDEEFLPDIEDCISELEFILDENGVAGDKAAFLKLVNEIQAYRNRY